MKAIKVKFLTAVLIVVLSFSLIDLCHGEKNRLMTASVDVGRADERRRDTGSSLFYIQ